jgi:hypothetical protein
MVSGGAPYCYYSASLQSEKTTRARDESRAERPPPNMQKPLWVVAVLVASLRPAVAQPLCDVTIVRAPDNVRVEIERWVATEPACASALEVRVVETVDGLYVFARDDRGFTRERLVPDGTSAAVLIASWAAADSIDGVWLPAQPPPPPSPVVKQPLQAPGMIDVTAPRPQGPGRALQLTGLTVAATGLVTIGVGVYFGLEAKAISDEIDSHDPRAPWSADIAQLSALGKQLETRQVMTMATGAALAVAGVGLYVIGRRRSAESYRVVPTASARGDVGVALGGRF